MQKWIYILLLTISISAQAQTDDDLSLDDLTSAENPSPPAADPLDVLDDAVEKKTTANETTEVPEVPKFTEIPDPEVPVSEVPNTEINTPEAKDTEVKKVEVEVEPIAPTAIEAEPIMPEPIKEAKEPVVAKKAQASPRALYPDEPNLRKEKEFYKIYSKYNQNPTTVEAWDTVLGTRNSEAYLIQKGDTLWDVSKTLFGDPDYWPKVWSLNTGSILNPHEINPKMQIQFFPGSMGETPTMNVSSIPLVKDEIFVEEEVEGKVVKKKIALDVPSRPVLKQLPSSIPEYKYNYLTKTPPMEVDAKKFLHKVGTQILTFFVAESPAQGIGEIVETEMGMDSAMEFQYVLVRLKAGVAAGTYRVIRNHDTISLSKKRSEAKAYMVEIQGEIEVKNLVNKKENIYRALVKSSINPVEVGSLLDAGSLEMVEVSEGPAVNRVSAKIIGGEWSAARSYVGTANYIFIDEPSRTLAKGDVLNVYGVQSLRNEKTYISDSDRLIGKVKIVHVDGRFSTAFVIQSDEEIHMGDRVAGTESAEDKM